MTRFISFVCLMMALLFSPTAVDAQDSASAITMEFDTTHVPNDELTAAILDLMKVTGAMNLGAQMAKNVTEMQKNNPNNQLPDEFFDRLIKEYESGPASKWILNGIVRIYRNKFRLEEVKLITAFYQTPAGKKAVSLLPAITQECMQEGQLIGRYLGMKLYMDLVSEGKIK